MGTLVLNGATSGSTTLQPTDATTQTITLPTGNVTLSFNGPAFSAYMGANQNISAATTTKISFNSKDFDTASCFDAVTNYRFTPNVAGYYQINLYVDFNSTGNDPPYGTIYVYKNGSPYKQFRNGVSTTTYVVGGPSMSTIVSMNGSTDYLEFYGNGASGGSGQYYFGASFTGVSGALVRAA